MPIEVIFMDSGREPECKADPKYPDGINVNLADNILQKKCCWNLPYPAPHCGCYLIICQKCGYRAAITVAGRADDPRTVTMPCKGN